MEISRLRIKNFKRFEDLDVVLHPKFNVFLGINGTGKTTLLEALRVAIGSLYLGFDKTEDRIQSPGIVNDDIRLENLEPQYPAEVEAWGKFSDFTIRRLMPETHWTRPVETRGGKTLTKYAKEIIEVSKDIRKSVQEGRKCTIPLVAFFSTDRYKKERKETKIEPEGSRFRGYFNALEQTTNIRFFLNLYMTETFDQIQNSADSELLAAVNSAVCDCVDCKGVEYMLKKQELFIINNDDSRIPFHLLSDGVRCMMAMVMELAFRCYLLNPHLGKSAPKETNGVVLIDELDLHLHPSWQRRVANDLRRAFPNLQFVVTTHAPMVISSLNDCRIFTISDGQVFDFPNQYGRDASYILEVMGVAKFERELKMQLEEYYRLIESGMGQSDEAMGFRQALNEKLGVGHPDLKRADMMLSFFSM